MSRSRIPTVPTYLWKPEHGFNWGDLLPFVILERLGFQPVEWKRSDKFCLLADGSVVGHLGISYFRKWQGQVLVWGSGHGYPLPPPKLPSSIELNVLGVRGHFTKQDLNVDDVYIGSPAFLAPKLLNVTSKLSEKEIFIPHHEDKEQVDLNVSVINPIVDSTDEVIRIVEEIATASFVYTSSLHGAILASAFNRPWAAFTQNKRWERKRLCQYKWQDFATTITSSIEQLVWNNSEESAKVWWEEIGTKFKINANVGDSIDDLSNLLENYLTE